MYSKDVTISVQLNILKSCRNPSATGIRKFGLAFPFAPNTGAGIEFRREVLIDKSLFEDPDLENKFSENIQISKLWLGQPILEKVC